MMKNSLIKCFVNLTFWAAIYTLDATLLMSTLPLQIIIGMMLVTLFAGIIITLLIWS